MSVVVQIGKLSLQLLSCTVSPVMGVILLSDVPKTEVLSWYLELILSLQYVL